jgi:hypothetical protein
MTDCDRNITTKDDFDFFTKQPANLEFIVESEIAGQS